MSACINKIIKMYTSQNITFHGFNPLRPGMVAEGHTYLNKRAAK